MRNFHRMVSAAGLLLVATQASATETVTYTYDAVGRLVSSASSGTVNAGKQTGTTYDAADNRTTYAVTPSPPTRAVVLPLNGFTVIPLP